MAAAQAMLRAASAVVLAAASLAGGRSSIEHHDVTLAQHDMTSRRLQNTIAGTMVSGLSAERGWCLDSVTFHYADGGTTKFGESGGGPVPRVDLNPTAEYVSGVLQYGATVGCRQYMEGGIEFIVKSIATGATTRTVSFAGSYQSSTVLREYNVEWPCRILGLEFDSRYIDGVQTDCTSAAEVRHDGESFSYVSCVDGAIIWNDRPYTISSVPDVLRGARLYQGPVRLAYNEALEISMPEGGRAFAAFTANRDGGMPAGLRDDGWVDVAPQGLNWDYYGQPEYIEPLLFKSIAPGETYISPKITGSDTVMFVVLDLDSEPPNDADDDNDSDDDSLVVILCVVGALLVVIAVVAMMNRQQKPAEPPSAPALPVHEPTAPPPPPPPSLAPIKAEALEMLAEETAEFAPEAASLPPGHVSGAEAAAMARGEPPPQQPSEGRGASTLQRLAFWREPTEVLAEEPPPPPEAEFEPEI